MVAALWLVVAFPLLGCAIVALFGQWLTKQAIGAVASGAVLLSFVVGLLVFFSLNGYPVDQRAQVVTPYTWIPGAQTVVNLSFLADPLSIVMVLIVSGVSFLIHVYSTGYMWHPAYTASETDQRGEFRRFFVYLNLFVASMLLLVTSDNFLLTMVGWEGVGLCSYLLISFEFRRNAATVAGIKAFVVNAIGDAAFLIGILLLFTRLGSVEYSSVFSQVGKLGAGMATAVALLFLFASTAKSAQIPLHTWLPDAMEGPTPVSALIHAATMVTAGVYLLARSYPLIAASPYAGGVIAVVGISTAFFAATIGLVQPDLKRVLAYSTISQLGYMFVAIGVAGYAAAIFHLMTHAFFKALLFLAAGNVIHALIPEGADLGEQDMRRMGGLQAKLPRTFGAMLVGALALAGMFPMSGFWSKDAILGDALLRNFWLYLFGLITALFTAFYIFRLMGMTFRGHFRGDAQLYEHAHEAPSNMLIPVTILAALAAVGGLLEIPGLWRVFSGYLAGTFTHYQIPASAQLPEESAIQFWLLAIVAIAVALSGIGVAWNWYGGQRIKDAPATLAQQANGLYRLLLGKYFVDELYDTAIVKPTLAISDFLGRVFDREVLDGIVRGVAMLLGGVGQGLRSIQTGYVRQYLLSMLVGVVIIVAFLLIR
ncbi:MAG: NADH-quinone oxidoreductase subunit L [Chloroflexi bacterium]|nr:NADH-quinone oxidoreductase subunit L [Chloroflexota bacterium]